MKELTHEQVISLVQKEMGDQEKERRIACAHKWRKEAELKEPIKMWCHTCNEERGNGMSCMICGASLSIIRNHPRSIRSLHRNDDAWPLQNESENVTAGF